MWSSLLFCVLVLFFSSSFGNAGKINKTEYYRLPPLFLLDYYDSCLFALQDAQYCLVDLQLAPSDNEHLSPAWNYIQNHSKDFRHYRYDLPQRGVCLHWCLLQDYRTGYSFASEYVLQQDLANSSVNSFKFPKETVELESFISECVNREFKKYNIIANVTKYYCRGVENVPVDSLDLGVILVMVVIALLVAAASIYDLRLRNVSPHNTFAEHYGKSVQHKYGRWLTTFSLCRNWMRLTCVNNTEEGKPLMPIQGVRFFTLMGVMACHACMTTFSNPTMNPEYQEMAVDQVDKQLMINGSVILQVFFSIGGFLLAHGFIKFQRKHKFNIKFYFLAIFNRWLRLTPVYAVIILLDATWAYRISDGPLWDKTMKFERENCRANWWANLLYISNYYKPDEPCVQQAWYLACDMQLFIVGMTILMICWKYPRLTKPLISLCVVVSLAIPGIIVYVNKLNGITLQVPEALKYLLIYDKTYQMSYIVGHCNGASYIIGMASAYLYYYLKENNIDVSKKKWYVALWWSLFIIVPLIIFSGVHYYVEDFQYNRIHAALSGSLIRGLYGILGGIFLIGITFGIGWYARALLCWGPLQGLGRLTFCAYLVHVIIYRMQTVAIRQPAHATDIYFVFLAFSAASLSYFTATIFCFGIEFPTSALQKLIFDKDKKDPEEVNKVPEEIDIYTIKDIQVNGKTFEQDRTRL